MNGSRIPEALTFAVKAHQSKKWKDTDRPFIHHPLAVAAMVQFYGGNDVQAQAAILHDTITEGVSVQELHKLFGLEVAELVSAFEDPPEVNQLKMNWADGKKAYIKKIENLPPQSVLVIACEELHELTVLLHDLKSQGSKVWNRYPVPGRDLGWYYKLLTATLYKKLTEDKYRPLISEFANQTKILTNQVFEGITP